MAGWHLRSSGREAWADFTGDGDGQGGLRAAVHGATKSCTRLGDGMIMLISYIPCQNKISINNNCPYCFVMNSCYFLFTFFFFLKKSINIGMDYTNLRKAGCLGPQWRVWLLLCGEQEPGESPEWRRNASWLSFNWSPIHYERGAKLEAASPVKRQLWLSRQRWWWLDQAEAVRVGRSGILGRLIFQR